jgi:hypothetical protein
MFRANRNSYRMAADCVTQLELIFSARTGLSIAVLLL